MLYRYRKAIAVVVIVKLAYKVSKIKIQKMLTIIGKYLGLPVCRVSTKSNA